MFIHSLTGNGASDIPTRTRASSAPAGLILVETTVRDLRQGMEDVARLYERRDRERAELAAAQASKTADKQPGQRSWTWNADGTRSAAAAPGSDEGGNRGNVEIAARRAAGAYDRARASAGDRERAPRQSDMATGGFAPDAPRFTARTL